MGRRDDLHGGRRRERERRRGADRLSIESAGPPRHRPALQRGSLMDDKERIARGKSIRAMAENTKREAERAAAKLVEMQEKCEHRLAQQEFRRRPDQRDAPAGSVVGDTPWLCVYCGHEVLVPTVKER